MIIVLHLPWPPSVNHYWRNTERRGKKALTDRGKKYRADVINHCMIVGWPKVSGRLGVRIDCYPPDRRKRDLDNLTKGILDALQHANVYDDDEAIDSLELHRHPISRDRHPVTKNGMVIVSINEFDV